MKVAHSNIEEVSSRRIDTQRGGKLKVKTGFSEVSGLTSNFVFVVPAAGREDRKGNVFNNGTNE